MGLDVFVEVIRASESLAALRTHEPLLSGVGPEVTLELVRPGEGFVAEHPATGEGSLPRVPSEVSLEVRGLAVDLATARDMAHMLPLLALLMGTSPILTVGTLAASTSSGSQALGVFEQSSCYLSILPIGSS